MGKPLTIQEDDEEKIDELKKKLGARTKIEVVRAGLDLLEKEILRENRVKRWKHAAQIVSEESYRVTREFQKHSRLKRNK